MDIRTFHPGDRYDFFNEEMGTPGYIQLVRPGTLELYSKADGTVSRSTSWANSAILFETPIARMYQARIPKALPAGEWYVLTYSGSGASTDPRLYGELIIVS